MALDGSAVGALLVWCQSGPPDHLVRYCMLTTSQRSPEFLDRVNERGVLSQLLADVRGGRSQVLVLRGAAGCGKTALLLQLSAAAKGCRIVRATGVESEMELAFAGLHSLCATLLGRLERLPKPQRE